MAKLSEIAAILLRLPDGRIVFNRRSKLAQVSPGLLAFYGGHVDEGETPSQAARREIEEETSIDISRLKFQFLGEYNLIEDVGKKFYLYEIAVKDYRFKVYEGDGSEVFSRGEALGRDDITPSVRHALEKIVKA